jgi:phospholipase/carboxylesterase
LLDKDRPVSPSNADSLWQHEQLTIGQLHCHLVVPSRDPATHLITLCHGFGAPGDDLLGLVPWFLEKMPSQLRHLRPAWLVPAAPLSLASDGFGDGRAWWRLSIQTMLDSFADGHYDVLRHHIPDGIDAARDALTETIEATLKRFSLPHSKLILGGFSQGAMLSVDTALRGLAQPPAGLWLYSGTLICELQWKPLAQRLQDTGIVQSHGTLDPILPQITGQWLCELLREAGNQVDFVSFVGPHTIPPEAITACWKSFEQRM